MKKTLLVMLSLAAAQIMAASDLRFLRAIAEVESGNDAMAVGKAGEVTAYQILPQNWRRQTTRPIEESTNPRLGQLIALRHLRWTKEQVRRLRPDVTEEMLQGPYFLAVLWRRGPYARYNVDDDTRDYALRVANIYGAIK